MSNIKYKKGVCIDCKKDKDDETPKVLIAGRCANFHYKIFRAEVNRAKEESEEVVEKKPLDFIGMRSNHSKQNQNKKCGIRPRSKKGQKVAKEDQAFFREIWKNRIHYSQVNGEFLGDVYNPVFFSHVLTKGAYPKARHWKENIILMTFDQHQEWEFDSRSTPEFKKKYGGVIKLYEELIERYYQK